MAVDLSDDIVKQAVRQHVRDYLILAQNACFAHYAGNPPKCGHCGKETMKLNVLIIDPRLRSWVRYKHKSGKVLCAWLRSRGFPVGVKYVCGPCQKGPLKAVMEKSIEDSRDYDYLWHSGAEF